MEIEILCDRCFKSVENERVVYKYGSAVYCEKCHEIIKKEIMKDMQDLYIQKNILGDDENEISEEDNLRIQQND